MGRRPGVFYGWVVAGVAFLALLVASGVRATPTILIDPLGDEFGWRVKQAGQLNSKMRLGTAPWLVLCGFLEGFATGPELPVAFQASLGFFLAFVFWGLVFRARRAT